MHLSTLTQSLFNKRDGLVILNTDACFGMYLYGLTVIFGLLHPLSRHYEKIGLKCFPSYFVCYKYEFNSRHFFLFFVNYLDYFPVLPSNLWLVWCFSNKSVPSSQFLSVSYNLCIIFFQNIQLKRHNNQMSCMNLDWILYQKLGDN